jgi:hypothetical protein
MANTRVTAGNYPLRHNKRENKVIETASSNLANANIASDAAIAVTKIATSDANKVLKVNSGGSANEFGKLTTDNLDASAGILGSQLAASADIAASQLAETVIREATVELTNAEVLALETTAIELVAAPGSDKVLQFIGAVLFLNYGGTQYTEADDNLGIYYENESGAIASEVIECTGFLDQAADTIINSIPTKDVIMVPNKALVIANPNDAFGGGHEDSTLTVKIQYRILETGF